ncbi:MAG: NADP-dependent oxidoreductase [Rhodocyclaceae bacterium]|nr:NADP-dependent oxidoreductase [Rhodocyclaceae bacterium]
MLPRRPPVVAPQNRQLRLARIPVGLITPGDFSLSSEPVPEPGEGQVLVRTTFISLDPTNRIWASGVPSYLPPVKIGDVMRSVGIGLVERSRAASLPEGSVVEGMLCWQEYTLAKAGELSPVVHYPGVPLERYPGVAPHIVLTAYFGLKEVGAAKPGETLVVSAAAGAVGSMASQMGKLMGMRVVGIAGGAEKCAWLRDIGFDGVIDYKSEDVAAGLKAHCPKGVDVYFDNVGGKMLDAVLARMNLFGRVAVCGLIANYNATEPVPGPYNFGAILIKRLTVRGFIVMDFYGRKDAAFAEIVPWVSEGRLQWKVDVVEGLENIPSAINMLFDGSNKGKLVVRV